MVGQGSISIDAVDIKNIRAINAPHEPRSKFKGTFLAIEGQACMPPPITARPISSLVADQHKIAPWAKTGAMGSDTASHSLASLVPETAVCTCRWWDHSACAGCRAISDAPDGRSTIARSDQRSRETHRIEASQTHKHTHTQTY